MGLDIRMPIGLLFTCLGLLLCLFGAFSDRAIYARSLGINVNLCWGIVLFIFGAIMLIFSARGAAQKTEQAEAQSKAKAQGRA